MWLNALALKLKKEVQFPKAFNSKNTVDWHSVNRFP